MNGWKERLLKNILHAPSSSEPERFDRTHIATCVILLEVAKSDDEFSTVEEDTTKAILRNEFSIPEEVLEDLMRAAEEKRDASIDLWEFTNQINQEFSREEKIKIIESAWKIIYADDKLDKYEDHLVHLLAKLLRLRHDELIDAKLRVRYGDLNDGSGLGEGGDEDR